jgi:hypothetical protein
MEIHSKANDDKDKQKETPMQVALEPQSAIEI